RRHTSCLSDWSSDVCSSDLISAPADRPLLSWTGTSAVDANRALLPKSFTEPDVHACAADPTRRYVGELFINGLDDPQVSWHWARSEERRVGKEGRVRCGSGV